jgi:hypothetical protein
LQYLKPRLRFRRALERQELLAGAAVEVALIKVDARARVAECGHELVIGRQVVDVVGVAAEEVFAPTP